MRLVLLSAMLLLAGGCAQLQTEVPQDVEFDLSGRLAARYGKDAFTGNIAWRHAKSADEMLITSSLGAGVARIVRNGDAVLGFRLPLSGLADWVRGRPSDKAGAKADYDEHGRLRSLEERGWKIDYQEYDGKLPSRMRLTYPDIELRLAISKWQ